MTATAHTSHVKMVALAGGISGRGLCLDRSGDGEEDHNEVCENGELGGKEWVL